MNSPLQGPDRWEKISEAKTASTRIFDLTAATYRHPRRKIEKDFSLIRSRDWVNVIALTPDHQIVLVNQFRYGLNDFSLEIPGGIVDGEESPLHAGLRELREETGFVGTTTQVLGSVSPNPAFQTNRCHFIFVENAVLAADLAWDEDEEIEVRTAPVEDVFAMARGGRITHSLVIAALFLFEEQWRKMKSPKARQSV
jgi:8-oxo-dGTP pyrophosphatase MutT (NUDIX family)